MSILLSIVIPTRNRAELAIHAVRSALRFESPELEVIVQDSSDTASLARELEKLPDPRLKYFYSKPPVTVVENFNIGITRSTGKYVCLIGDDDGVNPALMEAVKWASKHYVDVLSPRLSIVAFQWPGFRSKYFGGVQACQLYLWRFSGRVWFGDPAEALRECCHQAAQLSSIRDIPRPYLGVVHRQCLEAVKEKTGHYFGGVCPDIYGAIAVASVARRWLIIDYPLIVPGSSAKSTSGMSAYGKHSGEVREIEHFKQFRSVDWPAEIPFFWTVETVWAAGALSAFRDLVRGDLLEDFNFGALFGRCMLNHPGKIATWLRYFGRTGVDLNSLRAMGSMILTRGWRVLRRLANPSPARGAEAIGELRNIDEAITALIQTLSGSPLDMEQMIEGTSFPEVRAQHAEHY